MNPSPQAALYRSSNQQLSLPLPPSPPDPQVTLKGIAVFRYISALYYAFEGNVLTEFIGRKFSCEQGLEKAYLDLILSALPTLQPFERSTIMAQNKARPG